MSDELSKAIGEYCAKKKLQSGFLEVVPKESWRDVGLPYVNYILKEKKVKYLAEAAEVCNKIKDESRDKRKGKDMLSMMRDIVILGIKELGKVEEEDKLHEILQETIRQTYNKIKDEPSIFDKTDKKLADAFVNKISKLKPTK